MNTDPGDDIRSALSEIVTDLDVRLANKKIQLARVMSERRPRTRPEADRQAAVIGEALAEFDALGADKKPPAVVREAAWLLAHLDVLKEQMDTLPGGPMVVRFKGCKRCRMNDFTPVFTYEWPNGDVWVWNIDRAMDVLRENRPRPLVAVPVDDAKAILAKNEIDPAHVPHVDPNQAGIAVELAVGDHKELVLIDGNHRMARCVEMNQPFKVWVLDEAESGRCLIRKNGFVDVDGFKGVVFAE